MTSILAFVEYALSSRSQLRFGAPGPDGSVRRAHALDLTDFSGFWGGKDYKFIAAISGLRNELEIEPLHPLRGCQQT